MGILDMLLGSDSNKQELKVGDWVEILTIGEEGEIIEIHGDEYYVEIDNGRGTVDYFKANELKKITSLL